MNSSTAAKVTPVFLFIHLLIVLVQHSIGKLLAELMSNREENVGVLIAVLIRFGQLALGHGYKHTLVTLNHTQSGEDKAIGNGNSCKSNNLAGRIVQGVDGHGRNHSVRHS
nr:MAG TPA: hypothetical protein [Caudoviricetes sp.]